MASKPFIPRSPDPGHQGDDDLFDGAHSQRRLEDPETQPLLGPPDDSESWSPPLGFFFIQLALMSTVFLSGFDGTITAATYAVISSEFDAANSASWLTTSYLITSAAFQPLYGRVSDIFGRRVCFFISTMTFAIGCLGCGLAKSLLLLNISRAVAGFGGAGLYTMATIINSDMIPFRRRGMYHAMQNGVHGFGCISGASFGGTIADHIGWRWCFLFQVPIAIFAFGVGAFMLREEQHGFPSEDDWATVWKRVDFLGASLLIAAITVQVLGLSLGGNELPWSSPWVIGSLVGSIVLFYLFLRVEAKTTAMPMIPLRMLKGRLPIAVQIVNVLAGMGYYAYLFMLPLFFQVILLDSASRAGARLAIPSLATPFGALTAGIIMSRWGKLIPLMRVGLILMAIGNALVMSFAFEDSAWKYLVYIFPANFGTGVVYPSILFTLIAAFEHADHAVNTSTVYLVRSLGSIWGVSITSAIVQTTLSIRLPDALGDVPEKLTIIDEIRHSVDALRNLPPDLQLKARYVYYDALRYAFGTSTLAAVIGVCAAFVASASHLRKIHG